MLARNSIVFDSRIGYLNLTDKRYLTYGLKICALVFLKIND